MKAKIFQSGNSQAVRIPKEFRFEEAEVDIFKRAKDINQHTFTEGESWEWGDSAGKAFNEVESVSSKICHPAVKSTQTIKKSQNEPI